MPITPTNISKNVITPTGATKSSGSVFVNNSKTTMASLTTIGSPVGLLLALTYASVLTAGTPGQNLSKS